MRVILRIFLSEDSAQESRFLLVPGINHLWQHRKVVVLDEVLYGIGNLYRLSIH